MVNVIMPSVVMLNVAMLSVVMLNVVAPCLADDELILHVILQSVLLVNVVAHYVLISYNCQFHCHHQSCIVIITILLSAGFCIDLMQNALLLDVAAPQ